MIEAFFLSRGSGHEKSVIAAACHSPAAQPVRVIGLECRHRRRLHDGILRPARRRAAIPVEYRVNGWFSVASGLRYIGKPYNMAEDTTAAGGFDFYSSRNVSHFLEVPVSARFSLGNGTMRGFLGAGAYIGVRFLSTESGRLNSQGFLTTAGTDPGFWGIVELNPSSDNLFDAGLLAEAGFGCRLGGGELIISARYQYSFTSLDREYQKGLVYRYIDTLSVTAGYSFSIGGGK